MMTGKELKGSLPHYIVLLLDFYLLPLFIRDTGNGMILLLVVIPVICFFTSVSYGIKSGFHFRFALIVAALFAPSIFIFYNTSAWVYMIGYGFIALTGNAIALFFRKSVK